MIDYVSMGKRVRKFREAKGLTQSDLAYRIQKSNTTISHIEGGKAKPELNTVVDIANELGVTTDMLLCESLDHSMKAYGSELNDIFEKCSIDEMRLISEIVPPLVKSFRGITTEKFLKDLSFKEVK
ncbi:MAG: helix-turn-helix transcriptional regulator [Clostridia bacterium]|nr:helix-turn-helix transcriptional regulator [Clostridia bacterium]